MSAAYGPAIVPTVTYDDVASGLRWLERVLAFEPAAVYGPAGRPFFAQLAWRTGIVYVSARAPRDNPWSIAGPASIALTAENADTIDRLHRRAVAAGADVVRPPHTAVTPAFPDGSRQFDVRDPEGNLWTVGTFQPRAHSCSPIADVPPALLQIHLDAIKAGSEASYHALECDAARACADLGCPHPHMAIESISGPPEVWWLNEFASEAHREQVTRDYANQGALMAALARIARERPALLDLDVDVLARYDALGTECPAWPIAGARYMVVTVAADDRRLEGAVFESPDGRRFALAPCRTRAQAEAAAARGGPDARIFAVRPHWGMPAKGWIKADPAFWQSSPGARHPRLLVRRARESDFDAMWAIFRDVVAPGDTYVFAPDATREDALAYWLGAGATSFVAEEGDRVVGMYKICPNHRDLGSHVANASYMVAPACAGRGIGREMALHSLREARAQGFLAMQFNFVVSTNAAAVALWQSLGFTVVGILPRAFRHRTLGYVDAFVMFRSLEDLD